jgi:hypothetical protein
MVPNCAVGLEENMTAESLRAETVSTRWQPQTALPESTAVIELVSGCAEAQHPQAQRGAAASQD